MNLFHVTQYTPGGRGGSGGGRLGRGGLTTTTGVVLGAGVSLGTDIETDTPALSSGKAGIESGIAEPVYGPHLLRTGTRVPSVL